MSKIYPSERDHRTATPGVYRRGHYYRVLTRTDEGRKVMHRFETYEEAVAFKAQVPRRRAHNGLPRTNPRLRYLLNDPCPYCARRSVVFDHVEPRALGGAHHWSNIVGACEPCNQRKGTQSLLRFLMCHEPIEGTDLFAMIGVR